MGFGARLLAPRPRVLAADEEILRGLRPRQGARRGPGGLLTWLTKRRLPQQHEDSAEHPPPPTAPPHRHHTSLLFSSPLLSSANFVIREFLGANTSPGPQRTFALVVFCRSSCRGSPGSWSTLWQVIEKTDL
ncbi:hypothetical protein Taro_049235 [Colocasia esculenta]|uniref:Uncharacterized protein n=1 Tax=Colocasia esculenta TaxID=4460 RepID=A0A843XA95_COLES|nr:hypothetical protein [Colocasia esculenta]